MPKKTEVNKIRKKGPNSTFLISVLTSKSWFLIICNNSMTRKTVDKFDWTKLMLFKSQICFHLARKRLSTNLKKLKTKMWFQIRLRALEWILLSFQKYKTMWLIKVRQDLWHSLMGNNTTTHKLNLDRTTTSLLRANYKMKFKWTKVKRSRELTNNQRKIRCANR
jgi:hypothetical protein